MNNILKILSFTVDIFKGITSVTKSIKKQDRKKKDEKEASDIESILNNSK